jgi:LysR family transcriptional regulator, regulator for bpeEF and oprC
MALDRLKALEAFATVAELGSFTRAADALRLPKARVTTLVQELEAHLAVQLLQRTTRRLSLTEDGQACLQRATTLLQDMAELESTVTRAGAAPQGRLRVDVSAAAGRHVIAPALPDWARRYPHITLELGSSDRPVDLVAEGVDCVVRGGLVHDELLVARPLGELPVVTCAAPKYLRKYGTPRKLQDLDKHQFVNFFSAKTGRVFAFDFERDGIKHEVSRPHRVAANDSDTYIAAGVAGMGLMQTPCNRLVREHLAQGRLVRVLADWHAGSLPLVVLYPRARHLSAKVRAFADWAQTVFAPECVPLSNPL